MRVPAPLLRAAVLLALLAVPALVRADDAAVSAADGAAIRQVIESQMSAFRKDDGEAAFAFATPELRAQFGTADNFMTMVRSGYAPVYRPREVEFGKIEIMNGSPVQHVLLVGPDGKLAEALYVMQRQPDGTWRIAACFLTHADERSS